MTTSAISPLDVLGDRALAHVASDLDDGRDQDSVGLVLGAVADELPHALGAATVLC